MMAVGAASDVAGGFPTQQAAAARHLQASVLRLLASHKGLQSLTIRSNPAYDWDAVPEGPGDKWGPAAPTWGRPASYRGGSGACTEIDCCFDPSKRFREWDFDIDMAFSRGLVPALERLRLTCLSVPELLLCTWRKRSIRVLALSAVPLRRLEVTGLWSEATSNPVFYVVVDHAATLEELTLGDEFHTLTVEPMHPLHFWLCAKPVLPRLTALTLVSLDVTARGAANIRAACPALTHLAVEGEIWKAGAGGELRLPAAFRALSHLSWRSPPGHSIVPLAEELSTLLGSRTLAAISLSGSLGSTEDFLHMLYRISCLPPNCRFTPTGFCRP